jgi:dihydroflavonol-4-reductase
MNIFIAGGTGLIGAKAAELLIQHGHQVSSIALPPLPANAGIPKDMKLTFKNYMELNDDDLQSLFFDIDVFIFASGVDERIEFKHPVYASYQRYNIEPLEKMLSAAKKSGVKKAIILGSYFSYFAKTWKDLNLYETHPYIKSRIDQENMSFSFSDDTFEVMILELPYIFGAQKGRRPVWTMFIDMFEKPKKILFPKGGTTMVTLNQVAQAIEGAILYGKGKTAYPVGYYNMTWVELIRIILDAMGTPHKKIITVPNFLAQLGFNQKKKEYQKKGIEPGLNPSQFLKVMSKNAFIDSRYMIELGVQEDDIKKAIHESIHYAMEIKAHKLDVIDMKVK